MKYNEALAKKIIQKHGLSAKTLKVWAFRGKIPKRYADENYSISEKLEKHLQENLIRIFELPYLNISKILSVKDSKIRDVRRGGSSYTKAEYIEIKKEIVLLKNIIRAYLKTRVGDNDAHRAALEKVSKHYLIKPYVLLREQKGLLDNLKKGFVLHQELLEEAHFNITKTLTDLTL